MITLTAPQELLHKKNVNKKEGELIVPVESAIEISGNNCTINLPANSVTVLVLNKNN
jgi:hypothetical protein